MNKFSFISNRKLEKTKKTVRKLKPKNLKSWINLVLLVNASCNKTVSKLRM
jgi:hypothetical protein